METANINEQPGKPEVSRFKPCTRHRKEGGRNSQSKSTARWHLAGAVITGRIPSLAMTKEQLESEANGLIAAAKATVELQGDFPIMILIHQSTGWLRLPLPDEVAALMNYGEAKDIIFGTVREAVQKFAADGVIFATDAWRAETTPEGFKHYDTPEWRELHDTGFVKLLQRGWVKRTEAFIVTAQSATDVLIINQNYQRLESGMIQLLDCKRQWADQSAFNGRQKMFGDLRRENLGSEDAMKGKA